MTTFDLLLLVNGAGCAAGGLIPIVYARSGEPGAAVHGFAAGTLLGSALVLLVPEAARSLGPHVGYGVLGGFMVLYLIDRILQHNEASHGHEHTAAGHSHHIGALAMVGFGVHTISDGATLGVTRESPALTIPVVVGILFHEVPAQFVFARLLLASGVSRRVVASAVLGLALLMVGAAYAASGIVGSNGPGLVPYAISVSAGMFLFISTSELLPRVHDATRGRGFAVGAFVLGVLCAIVTREIGDHHH